MKPMSWKFLVLIDAGDELDAGPDAPMKWDQASPDGWCDALARPLSIPLGGAAARKIELDLRVSGGLAALDPAALAARLVAAAGGAAASEDLDTVLHHPSVQRLEAALRGLRLLAGHCGEAIELELLPTTRKRLVADFREKVYEPEMSSGDGSLSLILADFDFTHRPEDLGYLRELAVMAQDLQAPLVAAIAPGFFDLRYLAHAVNLPDLPARAGDPAHTAWRAFQSSEEARWVTLTLNRFLLRVPYVCSEPAYKESCAEARPESFLWGRAVWLAGAAAARSVCTYGHAWDLSGRGGQFDGLPSRLYPAAVNDPATLSTEVPMPDERALEFSRLAFAPLVGKLRGNTAVFPIVVTLFRLNPGMLTVEATLAYQMTAGRLARFCSLLLGEMPAGEEAVPFLKQELTGFLGPLAGGMPELAVTVEPLSEEADGRVTHSAKVTVKPAAPLEGKRIEYVFVLPLADQVSQS